MSQKIINELGEEVEVFTAEELQAQKDAAIEEFKANNPDKTEELTALQEELKKFKDKDLNFGNLRIQKEAAEKKVEEILKGVDEKISIVKKEVMEGVMQDHYNDTLKSLAGDDGELKKKIEFHYKRFQDPTATKQEMTKKLMDAWTLATKPEGTDALNATVLSSGGMFKVSSKEGGKKFTQEEKEFTKKWAASGGITLEEKDFQ